MKKNLFLFAMLASVAASATVTITPISTDYAAKKVTFKVAWTNSPTAPYNNRVWVWVDLCPVSGVTPQSFSTATITSPAITAGNGTITGATARGFFIEYGATNAGTTVTAILSNAPAGQFNWCVYGSDYPPNVTLDKGTYTFKGTTNFIVSSHAQPVTTKTITRTSLTVNSSSTFTDATGYPGIGQLYCPYTGSDLIMDATHLCQQRTSGAKNWEAWIKDTRDNELYRIVYMPDNNWWLAQNVKYAQTGTQPNWCNKDECGRYYSHSQVSASWDGTSGSGTNIQGICPPGWVLPVKNTYVTLLTTISPTTSVWLQKITPLDSKCSHDDYYGWASKKTLNNWGGTTGAAWEFLYTNDSDKPMLYTNDIDGHTAYDCGNAFWGGSQNWDIVRCFRQL